LPHANNWLSIERGEEPLIVSLPHTGTTVPKELLPSYCSPWLTLKDTDWHIEKLYCFAASIGATVIRTQISRSVIDVNREPSGASLYPGQTTTELCPTTTFDGEALYHDGKGPYAEEIERRKRLWFTPYHQAISKEIARLRQRHPNVVLYDCHSIRSIMPRLFDGELPVFNIGTNGGASTHPALTRKIDILCAASGMSHVVNGRFRGGYITRHHGKPEAGVHAVQMELACRAYLREPTGPVAEANWPAPYDIEYAAPVARILTDALRACLSFAKTRSLIEA
jgi:N-formylglutamate deformylase